MSGAAPQAGAPARTGSVAVTVTRTDDGATCELALPYTVHEPAPGATCSGAAIVYLHGGGLLFGERDDLPRPYVSAIVARGHALICLDYPLAPAASAPEIVRAMTEAVRALARSELPALGAPYLVLFGRSAGAYLALMVATRLAALCAGTDGTGTGATATASAEAASPVPQPIAIWDFYGYDSLAASFVHEPARAYAALPTVDEATVRRILAEDATQPPVSAPAARRYALYVYARQTGRWGALLGVTPEHAAGASLSERDVAALPPVFIAAGTADEDVPYRVAKDLARRAPHAQLHTAYYQGHDFDRNVADPAGRAAYDAALAFLDEQLAASCPGRCKRA